MRTYVLYERTFAVNLWGKLPSTRAALKRGGWYRSTRLGPTSRWTRSGYPVARPSKGRRIATETVADLATRKEGRELLFDDFGLTEEEVVDAVAYEEDVSSEGRRSLNRIVIDATCRWRVAKEVIKDARARTGLTEEQYWREVIHRHAHTFAVQEQATGFKYRCSTRRTEIII